jgi:hypothetical protein
LQLTINLLSFLSLAATLCLLLNHPIHLSCILSTTVGQLQWLNQMTHTNRRRIPALLRYRKCPGVHALSSRVANRPI